MIGHVFMRMSASENTLGLSFHFFLRLLPVYAAEGWLGLGDLDLLSLHACGGFSIFVLAAINATYGCCMIIRYNGQLKL